MTTSKLLADLTVPISDPTIGGEASPFSELGDFITVFFMFSLIVTALFSFVYLVMGGFMYITSAVDKVHVQTARDRITYAIMGLAIVAAAAAIFSVLGAVFGINIFGNINWPGPN